MNKKLEAALEAFHQEDDQEIIDRKMARLRSGVHKLVEKFKDEASKYLRDSGGGYINVNIFVAKDGAWGMDGKIRADEEDSLDVIFKNQSQEVH